MAKIIIKDSGSLDGEYEADFDYFLNDELHRIKEQTGLRLGDLQNAAENFDSDLAVALAAIALERNGKFNPWPALWKLPAGQIQIDLGEEAQPLPPENAPGDESNLRTSGAGSSSAGESQENGQSPTGTPALDISAISAPATSAD